ncbi:AraC family transcriptional regulator [Saccharospirillum sp. HFRX-1]|uniref:AraC family transcriptional regulator n=1 Tax=unclassified Saccharospirillum TaxID=2633430 RepID=UPI00371D761E
MSTSLMMAVNDILDQQPADSGCFHTAVAGLDIIRSFAQVEANHSLYRPSLCVVLTGEKQILLADQCLSYGQMQALVVSMDMPACGRIVEASKAGPFVGITLELDFSKLSELISQMDRPPVPSSAEATAVYVLDIDDQLADCLLRLIRLSQDPQAVPILAPAMMREIHYWLLRSPYGIELCKLAEPESQMHRIAKAIQLLRQRYTEPLRVDEIAKSVQMSASSFYQHFKAITSLSPIQYQKKLRLLEARRLMVSGAIRVTDAAYQVGYESLAQFSRDYSREFGAAPKRDITTLRAQLTGVYNGLAMAAN